MEYNVRVLAPEVLMEPLLSLLEEAEAVPLVISGSSMTPSWSMAGTRCCCQSPAAL